MSQYHVFAPTGRVVMRAVTGRITAFGDVEGKFAVVKCAAQMKPECFKHGAGDREVGEEFLRDGGDQFGAASVRSISTGFQISIARHFVSQAHTAVRPH